MQKKKVRAGGRTRRRAQVGWHPSKTTTQPCNSRTAEVFAVFAWIAINTNLAATLQIGILCQIFLEKSDSVCYTKNGELYAVEKRR
jgi:hypothetical protein